MLKKFEKNKKGFTLMELIIVIAILGIIIGIAVPKLAGIQDQAENRADKLTIQTINKAITIWCLIENKDTFDGATYGNTTINENSMVKDVITVLEGYDLLEDNVKLHNEAGWKYNPSTNQVEENMQS